MRTLVVVSSSPGITVRPLRWDGRRPHPDDLDLVAEAYREYETALTGSVDAARADLESYLELPDCDRAETALLVDGDDVVGSVYVQAEHVGKDVYVDVVVTTDERRRRATEAGVAHAAAAAGRIVAGRGEPGWTLRLTCPVQDDVLADVATEHGLERVRQFLRMQIDSDSPAIPAVAPTLPPGVELVVRDDEETRRALWAVDNEAFLDHWNFTPWPYEDWWEHFTAGSARDPDGWWLLTVDGEPAAFCILDESRAELGQGYVSVLGVRRAYRGRGLASLLLRRAFVRYRDMGRSATLLGVDAESLTGAVGVYERVGMRAVRVLQGWARELS
jgi:ribosomal protein S18 acetylase RimI-like enzyme